MDTVQTQRYILKRLSAAAERDDIIREICLRDGLRWPEAEALVQEVADTNAPVIYRRQSPILITTLLVDSLLGLFFVIISMAGLFTPTLVIGRITWAQLFHILKYGQAMSLLLLLGMSMLLGGLTGLVGVLYHVARNEGPLEED